MKKGYCFITVNGVKLTAMNLNDRNYLTNLTITNYINI